MTRKHFLKTSAAVGLVAPAVWASERKPAPAAIDRVSCTTVSFRHRFAATRVKNVSVAGPDFQLVDMPAMFVEKLGLRNVEVWSRHFPEPTIAFGEKLRAAADKAGARIVNVQQDEPPYELSNPAVEKRGAGIATIEQWMNIAAACGATSLRANVGGKPDEPFNLQAATDSFSRLAAHGEKLGVKILVENHGGHSLRTENVAAIVRAVNSPWCRSLPDFGNVPKGMTLDQRVAFLKKILPFAHLISAKGMEFDADYLHTSYDFAACVRAAEKAGFKGIYSIELWSPTYLPPDPIRAVRSLRDLVARAIA